MMTHQDVRAFLPWFVNGSLESGGRKSMETELARWPVLRGELAWLNGMRNYLQLQRASDGVQRSDSAGLDALMALVHGEQSGKVVPLRKRFTAWIASPERVRVAMGIAATIVLAQAAVIGVLMDQKESGVLVPLAGSAVVGGAQLQITFKPGTTELQIRSLMASVKGEIVAGPGAIGVYTIRVPEGQRNLVLDRLQKSGIDIVETAILLPPR